MLPADNNETFRVLGKDIYFNSAEEAQEYAKKHFEYLSKLNQQDIKYSVVKDFNDFRRYQEYNLENNHILKIIQHMYQIPLYRIMI